jgi:hypothetical protein
MSREQYDTATFSQMFKKKDGTYNHYKNQNMIVSCIKLDEIEFLKFAIDLFNPNEKDIFLFFETSLDNGSNKCFQYLISTNPSELFRYLISNDIVYVQELKKFNEESVIIFTKTALKYFLNKKYDYFIDTFEILFRICFVATEADTTQPWKDLFIPQSDTSQPLFKDLFNLLEEIVLTKIPELFSKYIKWVIKYNLSDKLNNSLSHQNIPFFDMFYYCQKYNHFDYYLIIKNRYFQDTKTGGTTIENKKEQYVKFLNTCIQNTQLDFIEDLLLEETRFLSNYGKYLTKNDIESIRNTTLSIFCIIYEKEKFYFGHTCKTKIKIEIFRLVVNHFNIIIDQDSIRYCVKYPVVSLLVPLIFKIDIEVYYNDYLTGEVNEELPSPKRLHLLDNVNINIMLNEEFISRIIRYIRPETNYIVKRLLTSMCPQKDKLINYQLFCLEILNIDIFKFIYDQWGFHSPVIFERIEIFNAGYTTFPVSEKQKFINLYREDPEWWNIYMLHADPKLYCILDRIEIYRKDKKRWTDEVCKLVSIPKDLRNIICDYI